MDSDKFENNEKRIEILSKEIKSPSEFIDAEFELFNVNGFSNNRATIPGASSLDYKFVIKVKSSDINKWKEGMVKFEPKNNNFDWTNEIIDKRKNQWITKSAPEYYNRPNENVLMIIYRTEGIIYKRVIRN
ncbi:hypothetical protein [Ulvibacter litoralis]|uniref:hypothetical protein n=1 Tax=Ulvibacter litoralis TaxID=227084 RepID=UPI0011131F58|nr:hypothetical protein [Ulvibacter litoralis]GHC66166.1 hypothetical protein GCM10008083_33990 [Ulvibacter litoralis]